MDQRARRGVNRVGSHSFRAAAALFARPEMNLR